MAKKTRASQSVCIYIYILTGRRKWDIYLQKKLVTNFSHTAILTQLYSLQVSPLLLATQRGHIKVVKVLLDYPRIDVTLTNEAGHNALAEAILKGYK